MLRGKLLWDHWSGPVFSWVWAQATRDCDVRGRVELQACTCTNNWGWAKFYNSSSCSAEWLCSGVHLRLHLVGFFSLCVRVCVSRNSTYSACFCFCLVRTQPCQRSLSAMSHELKGHPVWWNTSQPVSPLQTVYCRKQFNLLYWNQSGSLSVSVFSDLLLLIVHFRVSLLLNTAIGGTSHSMYVKDKRCL